MKVTLTFRDACCHSCMKACVDVIVCLEDSWAAKTVSGLPIATGKIVVINKIMEIVNPHCVGSLKTGKEICEYLIDIELDDQFIDDPETEEPYAPEDEDIEGISFDTCIINKLANFVSDGPEFQDFEGDIEVSGTLTLEDFTINAMRYWRWGDLVVVSYNVQVVLGGADDQFIYLPLPVPGTLIPSRAALVADDNGSMVQHAHVSYPGPTESQIGVRQQDLALWEDGETYNIYGTFQYEAET